MSEEVDDRLMRMANVLVDRTREKKISWDQLTNKLAFSYSGTDGSVTIDSKDNDGLVPFRFRVYNSDGIMIEDLVQEDPDEYDNVLGTLFHLASRQALRVEETLNSLLSELEHGDSPPF